MEETVWYPSEWNVNARIVKQLIHVLCLITILCALNVEKHLRFLQRIQKSDQAIYIKENLKLNRCGIHCKQIALWCTPRNVYQQCIRIMEYTMFFSIYTGIFMYLSSLAHYLTCNQSTINFYRWLCRCSYICNKRSHCMVTVTTDVTVLATITAEL